MEGEIHFHAKGTSGKKGKAPNYRRELMLPCGRCIGCRLDRSKQWAIRLMHEAQLHERTAFITLTYDNKRLPGEPCAATPRGFPRTPSQSPPGASSAGADLAPPRSSYLLTPHQLGLHYPHFSAFMRRLRKALRKRRGLQGKVRFYMCGEYGEQLSRPHYHLALYGEDFRDDRRLWRQENGSNYYRSELLEQLWPWGNSEIGALTIESAAYMARYIMKKITGEQAADHYRRVDPNTGNEYWLPPEFNVMSRRPGIGKEWWEKYKNDVYPTDKVMVKDMAMKPPRYYDKLLKAADAATYDLVEQGRILGHHSEDSTPARLAVREDVAKAKLAFKKRTYET